VSRHPITEEALTRVLSLRDLTDPAQGRHALQDLLRGILAALEELWRCPILEERASAVVTIADNYDRLHYPPDGAARDARYTRYLDEVTLLRTQTSALVPKALRRLAAAPPEDLLLVCPGLVYRRDVIDRLHTGEPHQVDLWRIRRGAPLGPADLASMVEAVASSSAPLRPVRTTPATHPYTEQGLQVEVADGDGWIEIGECGLASATLLRESGLPEDTSGLAMGLGLDRLLMLHKGIDDIRLLRSGDPRVAEQMLDLAPYRPVSRGPAIRRDLSLAVPAAMTLEEMGDTVRTALGQRATEVESVELIGETSGGSLSATAAARLGIRPGQKNVLLRLVLRSLERTLTSEEANELRDAAYAALHRGLLHSWARGAPLVGWARSAKEEP